MAMVPNSLYKTCSVGKVVISLFTDSKMYGSPLRQVQGTNGTWDAALSGGGLKSLSLDLVDTTKACI
jgi:hypothetical protein